MASRSNKYHDNVAGQFYVDKDCIDCSLCSEIAPNNFMRSEDQDHDICYKQPNNEEELKTCLEALDSCPVEAIGQDGFD